jgi:hypothetical protein
MTTTLGIIKGINKKTKTVYCETHNGACVFSSKYTGIIPKIETEYCFNKTKEGWTLEMPERKNVLSLINELLDKCIMWIFG